MNHFDCNKLLIVELCLFYNRTQLIRRATTLERQFLLRSCVIPGLLEKRKVNSDVFCSSIRYIPEGCDIS